MASFHNNWVAISISQCHRIFVECHSSALNWQTLNSSFFTGNMEQISPDIHQEPGIHNTGYESELQSRGKGVGTPLILLFIQMH